MSIVAEKSGTELLKTLLFMGCTWDVHHETTNHKKKDLEEPINFIFPSDALIYVDGQSF